MNGDCLERMNEIPDNSIDAVITDIPYNISQNNNFDTMGRKGIDFGNWDYDINNLSMLYNKIKSNGSLFLFHSYLFHRLFLTNKGKILLKIFKNKLV